MSRQYTHHRLCPSGGHQPQNVHLSWGDTPNQVVVLWATSSPCSPELTYGTTPWRLDLSVTGRSVTYNEHNLHGLHVLHRAVMKVMTVSYLILSIP